MENITYVAYELVHRVKYLIRLPSGNVITSQHRAWNDEIRMMMWIELIAVPWMATHGNKLFIWFDNSSIHLTYNVQTMFQHYGIDVALLPKNMTGILQPLDLSCNGPFKKLLRAKLVERMFKYFEMYKRLYRTSPPEKRKKMRFNCPPPALSEVIPYMLQIVSDFSDSSVSTALKNDFITVGMVPNENGVFTKYFERNKTCGCFLVDEGSFTANYISHVANVERPNDRFDEANLEEMTMVQALESRCVKSHFADGDSDDEDDDHSL